MRPASRRLPPLPSGEGRGEGGGRAPTADDRRHRAPIRVDHAHPRQRPAPDPRTVSEFTATRLSIYLRGLAVLEATGVRHVSSKDFARRFDFNSAQIRKDLAIFGEFGVRGVGYEVSELRKHLTSILGLDRTRRLVIVGAGHLGQALADYGGFRSGGFAIAGLFDNDAAKIGTRTRVGVEVRDVALLAETVARESVEIGVIAVPASAAAAVSRRCAAAGLKALLNFAPARLNPPAGVRVKNVDLTINLETLAFYIPSPTTKGASP